MEYTRSIFIECDEQTNLKNVRVLKQDNSTEETKLITHINNELHTLLNLHSILTTNVINNTEIENYKNQIECQLNEHYNKKVIEFEKNQEYEIKNHQLKLTYEIEGYKNEISQLQIQNEKINEKNKLTEDKNNQHIETYENYITNLRNEKNKLLNNNQEIIQNEVNKQLEEYKSTEDKLKKSIDEYSNKLSNFEIDKQNQLHQEREKHKLYYETEIETHKQTIYKNREDEKQLREMYETRIRNEKTELKNTYTKMIEDLKTEKQEIISQNEVRYNNISSSFTKFDTYFEQNNKNINKIGLEGEKMITTILNDISQLKGLIEDTSGQTNSGDIFYTYENMKCCIESKNYTRAIPKPEITKFEKDMTNERYNCGIFVSLKTSFAPNTKLNNFDIKFIDNKPCIFISNAEIELKNNLILAIKTLKFLLNNLSNNDRLIMNTIDYLKSCTHTLGELEKELEKQRKNVLKMNKIIKTKRTDIEFFIDKFMINEEDIEDTSSKVEDISDTSSEDIISDTSIEDK